MSRVLRFPRRAHLRASAEFQAVFGGGTRFNHPLFRLQQPTLPPGDYVFQARPEAAQVDNPGLRAALLKLLDRATIALKPPVATGTMPPAAAVASNPAPNPTAP